MGSLLISLIIIEMRWHMANYDNLILLIPIEIYSKTCLQLKPPTKFDMSIHKLSLTAIC